ncbi:MAG: MFS transporter [Marinilabiliales bacterium]|nr:MAG: MFS transporter [Marinilabiliales bacterium]
MITKKQYSNRSLFIAGCMGMLIFGIVMAVLGSVLPSVIEKYGIDMVDAGTLFLVLNLGMLIGSVIFGPLVDRYGYKGLLVMCAALVFASIEGIALAPGVNILRISLFFVGFAGGAINGGTNALVSDISDGQRGARLSLLGVFFGIGALGVPLLLGSLLDRFAYESLIGFVGALILIPLLFFIFLKFPAPKHAQGFPVSEGLKLTREAPLLLFGLILFIQSGMEMTVSGWSATYMNEYLAISARQAVLFLSFYWTGMIFTRIAITSLLQKAERRKVVLVSLLVSVAGTTIILMSNSVVMVVAGLLLTGIGFAAIFPLVFSYVGDLYPRLSGTAFSVILAIALLGGMTYPSVVGILAENLDLRSAFMVAPVSLVISAVIFMVLSKRIASLK